MNLKKVLTSVLMLGIFLISSGVVAAEKDGTAYLEKHESKMSVVSFGDNGTFKAVLSSLTLEGWQSVSKFSESDNYIIILASKNARISRFWKDGSSCSLFIFYRKSSNVSRSVAKHVGYLEGMYSLE